LLRIPLCCHGAPTINDNFSDIDLPEQEDYRAVMDQTIKDMRQAIHEAFGYIERQEDGPLTMTYVLRKAEKRLSAVECESWYITSQINRLHTIITKLLEQRDEAIRQRDLLMLFAAWSSSPDDPPQ